MLSRDPAPHYFSFEQSSIDPIALQIHHPNADTFDHLRAADLRQASVVLAGSLTLRTGAPIVYPGSRIYKLAAILVGMLLSRTDLRIKG